MQLCEFLVFRWLMLLRGGDADARDGVGDGADGGGAVQAGRAATLLTGLLHGLSP